MDPRSTSAQQIPAGKRDPAARQRRLLLAAREEFAAKGLEGARVDEIARRASVNKQLVYHYFGNKEGLYLRVLEETYAAMIKAKESLNLGELSAPDAVERLVDFTFDFYVNNRDFVKLLNDENIHEARHIKGSKKINAMYSGLVGMLDDVLRRGEKDGSLRAGIDTVQFYITLSGMCYFYITNIHTLSVVFDRDLSSDEALEKRRRHIIDTIMTSVRP
ncbi:MAG: TetR family transcriptional regulator [Rhodospirillales bacterium]|nr:TetR family transcriptional regulator [Rhodospirillales bacterium]